jgi:hypothetical protein
MARALPAEHQLIGAIASRPEMNSDLTRKEQPGDKSHLKKRTQSLSAVVPGRSGYVT